MVEKNKASLKTVVDTQTYTVWVKMLAELVPESRTHRMAPLIAGMLQYAAQMAHTNQKDAEEGTVAHALLNLDDVYDPEGFVRTLLDAVHQLFRDAKVSFDRYNARGQHYSIVSQAIAEFLHWYDMPWEY